MTGEKITIKNMTGHDIDLENGTSIQSDGMIRLTQTLDVKDFIDTKHGNITIGKSIYGEAQLPQKKKNTIYIVSNVVCVQHNDRDDLYMPRGKTYVNGEIKARGLQQNPYLIE